MTIDELSERSPTLAALLRLDGVAATQNDVLIELDALIREARATEVERSGSLADYEVRERADAIRRGEL